VPGPTGFPLVHKPCVSADGGGDRDKKSGKASDDDLEFNRLNVASILLYEGHSTVDRRVIDFMNSLLIAHDFLIGLSVTLVGRFVLWRVEL